MAKRAAAAGDWRPGTQAGARAAKDMARSLTSAAIDAGDAGLAARALTARAEAQIADRVARHVPAVLDPSGALPYGPARGGLVNVEMLEPAIDPKTGRDVVKKTEVRKRRGPSALASMPISLRLAAETYAALVEAHKSPGGPAPAGPRGGGISDGGATSRCELARRLGLAVEAIGDESIRFPPGSAMDADRPRRIVTVRRLVDLVCLKGWSIRRVLASHGWSRAKSRQKLLRDALEAALGRIADAV